LGKPLNLQTTATAARSQLGLSERRSLKILNAEIAEIAEGGDG
jgi:hypothetical protein